MGQIQSRRGARAALTTGPSHDRRRRPAARRADARPLLTARPGLRSVQAEPAGPARFDVGGSDSGRAPAFGPSLRQDVPRPPLRGLLLLAMRRAAPAWERGLERAQAHAAPVTDPVIARLDAHVRQPALWLLLPAQRETLARGMAALSVAIVVLGWTALWWTLAPAPAARPPAPSKQFTARVVSPALPAAELQEAEAPSVPADDGHDALALAAEPPLPKASRVRARRDVERAAARATEARDAAAPAAKQRQAAAPVPARHKARRATARKAAPAARAPRAARSRAASAAVY